MALRLVRPGSGMAAVWESIWAAGDDVRLVDGTYTCESIPDVPSGRSLLGPGSDRCTILTTLAPSSNDADLSTNCLINVAGSLDAATLDTTLTTSISPGGVSYYGAGARKVSVAGVGTLATSQYVLLGGHSDLAGLSPGGSNGSGVDYYEIHRVDAISSLKLTLDQPTLLYHSTGAGGAGGTTPRSVKRVLPARNVTLRGFTLSATGGTIAVGIRLAYAMGVRIEDVKVEGFSRAGVECTLGSQDIDIDGLIKGTECQCAVLVRSAHLGRITGLRCLPDAALRAHANGLRRAVLVFEHGGVNWTVDGFRIQHAVQGISIRGGYHIGIANGTIDDCDIRTQNGADGYHGTLRGVGICTGAGEGAHDEYVGPTSITNVTVSNCRSASTANGDVNDPLEFSVLAHDCHSSNWSNISIVNNGLSDQTTIDGDADYRMFGFGIQDASGTFDGIEIKGVQYGFAIRSTAGMVLSNCKHLGAPGTGASSNISLWSEYGNGVDIRNFDGDGYVWFGSGFGSGSPYLTSMSGTFRLVEKRVEGPLFVALNTTGGAVAHGDIVELDATSAAGTRKVILPTATPKLLCMVVGRYGLSGYPHNDYCLVKGLPSEGASVNVNGVVALGDHIDAATGSLLGVVAGSPTAKTVGQSMTSKGAGTALVELKPTSWAS